MANLFLTPNYICMGEGALHHSKEHMKKLGTKALVVTDTSMIKLNNVKKLTELLDEIEIVKKRYPNKAEVENELEIIEFIRNNFESATTTI